MPTGPRRSTAWVRTRPQRSNLFFLALLSRVATSALGLRSTRIPTTPHLECAPFGLAQSRLFRKPRKVRRPLLWWRRRKNQRCASPHSRIALMNGMPYRSATQSASISTNHSRLMKPFTSTKVMAGRIAAKNSPCARAAASHCEISVNMIRVRITVSRERPASTTASAMISRQRLVWP